MQTRQIRNTSSLKDLDHELWGSIISPTCEILKFTTHGLQEIFRRAVLHLGRASKAYLPRGHMGLAAVLRARTCITVRTGGNGDDAEWGWPDRPYGWLRAVLSTETCVPAYLACFSTSHAWGVGWIEKMRSSQ